MDKLKVLVGLVYTQLMFCDGNGKLQFHRVVTDVDRPWLSIIEVLGMIKQAILMDKPFDYNFRLKSVHIDIQYQKSDFTYTLDKLSDELEHYLPEDCKVLIQTINHRCEMVDEQAKAEVDEWEATLLDFSPIEARDRFIERDSIHLSLVQKEWNVPLIYTVSSISMSSNEPYKPFRKRIKSRELLLDDRITTLIKDEEQLSWKKETDLRGSPM